MLNTLRDDRRAGIASETTTRPHDWNEGCLAATKINEHMVVLIEVDAGIAPKSLLEQSLAILLFLPQSVLSLLCVVCLVVDEPSPM